MAAQGAEMPVATLNVRGEEFSVMLHVNRDNTASFRVDQAEPRRIFISEDTLKGVYDKLMRETKKAKVTVEVPFTEHNTLTPGVATGLHAGTGKVMARIENRYGRATAEQIDGYGDHFTPLDPAEVGELKSLRQKALDAKRAVEAFEKPRRLDLRIAVRNAINVKTEEALAAETG